MNYYIRMTQKQAIFSLLGGRVQINRGIYNPTSDAVWLAAFAPTNARTVLDVGIGTGGAALCLMAHNPNASVSGVDTSQQMLAECAANAELNNRAIELINTDITTWRTDRTFDLVITNPPYFQGTPAKHNAHHNADITQWTRAALRRVKPRGRFCTIVDAACVGDVIAALNGVCGDITVFPLFGAKKTAERVLVGARKGVKGGTTLHAGLPMNYEPVLRDGLTIADALARLI